METSKTTFASLIGLSGTEARDARVKNVCRNTSNASRNHVEGLKSEFRDIQTKLFNHMDLGQTDTTSLVVGKEFDPKTWIEEMYDMRLNLVILARKIEIAVKGHNQLFPENKTSGLDEEDMALISGIVSESAAEDDTLA